MHVINEEKKNSGEKIRLRVTKEEKVKIAEEPGREMNYTSH